MTLAEFLLARVAEKEEEAQQGVAALDPGQTELDVTIWDLDTGVRYRPHHVLAECEAQRRIVEEHTPRSAHGWDEPRDVCLHRTENPCPTLRLLALPYADHPDYRPEWLPSPREEPT